MTELFYLGVDVGTTAVKAAVFDINGKTHASSTHDSGITRAHAGWSDQSMDEVWQLTAKAIRTVTAEVPAEKIASIGVCGQGDGLWALDKDNRPVRDAILWNDQRAEAFILKWIKDGTSDKLSRYCRTANWPGTAGSIFHWLKENEPENAKRVETVLFCKDWVNHNLTGNLSTDFSDSTIPFLNLEKRQYAPEAFAFLDVEELAGKLPAPQRANKMHGTLRTELAQEFGLGSDIPVATGAIDLGAMMVGMDLSKTGDVCMILGTTAVVNVISDPAPFNGPPPAANLAHPYLDKWIQVLAPSSGASALDWFTAIHPKDFGGNTPVEIANRFNKVAKSAPPGANGVMFLPFLAGERAPFVAPHATASFIGINASTTQADIARAIMEGTAYSLRHCFEATKVEKPGHIFLTGGGARNPFWCDIVASVMNTDIVASDASDHGLWGAALLGASAAGLIDINDPPVRNEATRRHSPDQKAVATYQNYFQLYEKCVAASATIWDAHRQMTTGAL